MFAGSPFKALPTEEERLCVGEEDSEEVSLSPVNRTLIDGRRDASAKLVVRLGHPKQGATVASSSSSSSPLARAVSILTPGKKHRLLLRQECGPVARAQSPAGRRMQRAVEGPEAAVAIGDAVAERVRPEGIVPASEIKEEVDDRGRLPLMAPQVPRQRHEGKQQQQQLRNRSMPASVQPQVPASKTLLDSALALVRTLRGSRDPEMARAAVSAAREALRRAPRDAGAVFAGAGAVEALAASATGPWADAGLVRDAVGLLQALSEDKAASPAIGASATASQVTSF
jgi:hypothetical protein